MSARSEGGEGVVGDLRPGGGDGGQEGGLAGVGQADEAAVGDQFQPQPDGFFLALLAGVGPIRRLVHRALEIGVAEAAVAAFQQADPHARLVQVGDQGLVVFLIDLGPDRHLQLDVLAVAAMTVTAHAVDAGLGAEVLPVAEVDQGVQSIHRLDPDVTATAAVAAIGSAVFDELLAPERDRAAAAVAGTDVDLALVEKLHGGQFCLRRAAASMLLLSRSWERWTRTK